MRLPTICTLKSGETLTLYIASSNSTVSVALVSEKGDNKQVQCLVYYLSRALQATEVQFPSIERLALVVVFATRRLKPYFQVHKIIIPTNYLVLQILRKLDISGRLTKWAMELSEFDISFTPTKVIKGQKLADFVEKLTPKFEEA